MIVSTQSLALFLEQEHSGWNALKLARAKEHIETAGQTVRGALASLYVIPAYTRDSSGAVTSPAGLTADPMTTALAPIVKMMAAASLLNPARGYQPQEDRSAAGEYIIDAKARLNALAAVKNGALIAPISSLAGMGITATAALISMANSQNSNPIPAVRQITTGMFGAIHDPSSGSEFEL